MKVKKTLSPPKQQGLSLRLCFFYIQVDCVWGDGQLRGAGQLQQGAGQGRGARQQRGASQGQGDSHCLSTGQSKTSKSAVVISSQQEQLSVFDDDDDHKMINNFNMIPNVIF